MRSRAGRVRLVRAVVRGAGVAAGAARVPASASATPQGAPQSRVVISGMTRFEVLSPTLVRAEYSPSGTFEDRPTETAMGRQAMLTAPAPHYSVSDDGVTLTI